MKAVEIKKKRIRDGKETIFTYIGKDEADCLSQAKKHPYKKGVILSDQDYTWEVLEASERRGQNRLERFQDRYGYKPAFGDYEATGWMDEK